MATLTADSFRSKSKGVPSLEIEVVTAAVLFHGAYVAGGHVDHATAANRGRLQEMADDTAGLVPMGFSSQKRTGDTAASPTIKGIVHTDGGLVKNITVTDDAADITDQFRWVYCVNDNDFTLARPTTIAVPVGITTRFIAANTFDVHFFSFECMLAIAAAGGTRRVECMGSFMAEGGASAVDAIKGMIIPWHAHITDYFLICTSAPADADVAGPVTLELGGTNIDFVTTQPLVGFADTLALKISGVGGIAATACHEGDLLDLETVYTAAGTVGDGLYNLYVDFTMQPGG